jgi:hypothetical protein
MEKKRVNASQKPGTKWTSVAVREDIVERLKREADRRGISASGLANQTLDANLPK